MPPVNPRKAHPSAGNPDRTPPHNLQAEMGLLAAIILEGGGDILTTCRSRKVRPEHFFSVAHQIIYEAACALNDEGKPVDDLTLCERLHKTGELASAGGPSYISEITRSIEVTAHAIHWMEIIIEKNLRRRLITTAISTVENAYSPKDDARTLVEGAERAFMEIGVSLTGEDSVRPAEDAVEGSRAYINKLISSRGALPGIPTGFKRMDDCLGGFEPGRVYVVAARPGMGKTSVALNFIESAVFADGAKKPAPKTSDAILMVSLEMPQDELMTRLACSKARLDLKKLREGFFNTEQMRALDEVYSQYKASPLFIDDTGGQTIQEIRAKARHLKAKQGLRMVVIDYIQLIESTDGNPNREQQIAGVSRAVKAMAKELRVPVILLAQLNRKSEDEARHPRLSDLRESGSIEQDADVVILISRQNPGSDIKEEEGLATVKRLFLIAKNRGGQTGDFIGTEFVRHLTRFQDPIHGAVEAA